MGSIAHLKDVCNISLRLCKLRSLNLLVPSIMRLHNTTAAIANKSEQDQWRIIYKLPIIRLASAFNRLKIYQALITTVCLPASLVMEQAGLVPESSSLVVGAIGVSGLMTLAISSLAVKNLIGIIYINENHEKLKFAYVDYWGKRQHTYVHVDDILLNNSENKPYHFGGYQTISSTNRKNISYKIIKTYAEIVDYDTYAEIFGSS